MTIIQITAVQLENGHVVLGYSYDDQKFSVRCGGGDYIIRYTRNEMVELYGEDAVCFCMATFEC